MFNTITMMTTKLQSNKQTFPWNNDYHDEVNIYTMKLLNEPNLTESTTGFGN